MTFIFKTRSSGVYYAVDTTHIHTHKRVIYTVLPNLTDTYCLNRKRFQEKSLLAGKVSVIYTSYLEGLRVLPQPKYRI